MLRQSVSWSLFAERLVVAIAYVPAKRPTKVCLHLVGMFVDANRLLVKLKCARQGKTNRHLGAQATFFLALAVDDDKISKP